MCQDLYIKSGWSRGTFSAFIDMTIYAIQTPIA